jgi:hypothetical protein
VEFPTKEEEEEKKKEKEFRNILLSMFVVFCEKLLIFIVF